MPPRERDRAPRRSAFVVGRRRGLQGNRGRRRPYISAAQDESHFRTSGAGAGFGKRLLPMNLFVSIGPLVALIAGILILIVPRLLNYIVAIYLIVIGLLGLFGGRLFA